MDPSLHDAAVSGNLEVLRDVAEREPSILMQLSRPTRNTVLHVAANSDHRTFVELLSGYCPSLIEKKNSSGDTPLHIAAKAGHLSVLEFLIEWAVYFVGSFSRDAGDNRESDANVLLRVPNKYGNTALHEAVRTRNLEGVNALMSTDPQSMSIVNKHGESPLYLAVDRGLVLTLQNMLALIPQDASGNIYGGPNGKTLMHAAVAKRERKEILYILLQEKKELTKVVDDDERTPLHYAASFGYLKGVELLLNGDASVAYQKEKDGLLPIHMAAIKGHSDIVERMLKHCPGLGEFLNREDQNVLHVAAKSGKQNVVKSMLKMRKLSKLINETDNKGNTPLHLATIHWHPKIVSTLVRDKKVDMSVMNDEGLTALDIAEKDIDTLASFRKLLTLAALRAANAPRDEHRMVIEGNNQPRRNLTVEFYRDRINTLVLVAALITTVTFAAGFTIPGGFNNDGPRQGLATMLTKMGFHIFLICNTIAMYSSIIAAITLIWAQLGDIDLLVTALRISLALLAIALTMMAMAFAAGVYLVVSKLKWLAYLVLVMSFGFVLCILALLVALQVPLWSKFPILRSICYCVFRLLVHAIGQRLDGIDSDFL